MKGAIKMKIGASTSCFYPLETELALENLGKAGIKTTEIFFNATSELKESFIDILEEIQKEYKIDVTAIHPTMSLAESFMIFSAYERRFYEAIELYHRYSEIAARLGAKFIIMHGGKPNGILSDEEYCEKYMLIKEAALKNGITVLQENVAKHRAGEFEFLKAMRDILGKDAEFCFDLKQSLRSGYEPYMLIDEFKDNIKHYHISDHTVSSDCLLPLDGGFDFKEFFNKLKNFGYNGTAIIEVYSSCYKDYNQIYNSYKNLKELI